MSPVSVLHSVCAAAAGLDPARTTHAALSKCLARYKTAQAEYLREEGISQHSAHQRGSAAYRLAMPQMEDLNSIRAYIACVAQGIQLEVFNGRDGSQLLYAAQVAISLYLPRPGRGIDISAEVADAQ